MPLTEADLNAKECIHCRRNLREHCVPVDGGWLYTPCLPLLRACGLAPAGWWVQVNEHGLCLACSRPAVAHFRLMAPQVSVQLSLGPVETIVAAGQVMLRHPVSFSCPPAERERS